MALRNDIDLSWLEESMLAPQTAGITEKGWVTIHGHPVLIGGASGGSGGKGGSGGHASASGGGGSAVDGHLVKPDKNGVDPLTPHTYPKTTHAAPNQSQQEWKHAIIDTPFRQGQHVRFQTTSKYMGGTHDRINYEGPGGQRGNIEITKANMKPARAYTSEEHDEVDKGQGALSAAANVYQAGYGAPAGSSQYSHPKKKFPKGPKPFTEPADYKP